MRFPVSSKKILREYLEFHQVQQYSTDMDPIYPVLKYIIDKTRIHREESIWLTFLYVAYYNIGSALLAFEKYPTPELPSDLLKLPCATERRNHRTPENLKKHLTNYVDIYWWYDGFENWLLNDFCEHPKMNWEITQEKLQQVWGNGRWACYKTAEVLWKVNGLNLEATDMGHAHSSGSRKGLELLYNNLPKGNTENEIKLLDTISDDLVLYMKRCGLEVSIETAETSLCDFNSLRKGKYYSGIDIDHMQEDLIKTPSVYTDLAFEGRRKLIPNEYLGELNGWDGVRKEKKKEYVIQQQSKP